MQYQRHGWPQDDDLLLCTVTSVQYNSVFCDLDEFPGKSGMIHISEVTAGRIRNIREYVQEGRKIVCKVLHIDQAKGHIDLSLRRVNERQRIEKNQALKQELKAENLLAHLAKELKRKPEELYAEVAAPILEHYDYIHQAFEAIVEETFDLGKTGLDKKLVEKLTALVKERIKPKQVDIEGTLSITTYAENGVTLVKQALLEAQKTPADIRYLGGGAYHVHVTAEDYKAAEKLLKTAVDAVEHTFKKVPASTVAFTRQDE